MFQFRQDKDAVVDVDGSKNEQYDINEDHKENEDEQPDTTIGAKSNQQNEQTKEEDENGEDQDKEEELQDLERRIAFTDAVVAVALTLLILPLMDAAGDDGSVGEDGGNSTAAWFQENRERLLSFLLSFAAIGAFWKSHDRLFSRLAHCTPWLSFLNFTWMLAIVFTPISTELIHRSNNDSSASESLQHFVYIGNMALIDALYCLMIGYVRHRPILWKKQRYGGSILRVLFIEGCVDLGLLILALAISTTSSESGYLALLLLLLGPIVLRIVYWIQPSLRHETT